MIVLVSIVLSNLRRVPRRYREDPPSRRMSPTPSTAPCPVFRKGKHRRAGSRVPCKLPGKATHCEYGRPCGFDGKGNYAVLEISQPLSIRITRLPLSLGWLAEGFRIAKAVGAAMSRPTESRNLLHRAIATAAGQVGEPHVNQMNRLARRLKCGAIPQHEKQSPCCAISVCSPARKRVCAIVDRFASSFRGR